MQRLFLNNPETPTIAKIKYEWPLLLKPDMIYWHYEKLMGHSIHHLKTTFNTKMIKILTFGLSKKYIDMIPDDETKKQLEVFKILGSYFNEDLETLLVHGSNKV